jgi:hypothetical protein
VTEGWRKMDIAVQDWLFLTNNIKVIIPKRMKLAGHEACTGKNRNNCIQVFCGKT